MLSEENPITQTNRCNSRDYRSSSDPNVIKAGLNINRAFLLVYGPDLWRIIFVSGIEYSLSPMSKMAGMVY